LIILVALAGDQHEIVCACLRCIVCPVTAIQEAMRWSLLAYWLLGAIYAPNCFAVETSLTPETNHLRLLGRPLGDQSPTVIRYDSASLPGGTFIVQDKSKGVTWFLNLTKGLARAVELPFNNGNHESSLSADGLTLASPHYETLGPGDPEGGGFYPGSEVSLVDVKSGRSSVLTAIANPLGRPKPHGVQWLANSDLIVTAQLANSLIRYARPLDPAGGAATVFSFAGTACHTPHLVREIPASRLVVTGCRCTNPGDRPSCGGALAVADLQSGATRVLPAGLGAEGITVTRQGEVWLGDLRSNQVSIYGFAGPERRLDDLKLIKQIAVAKPLRLAYEPRSNTVGIVSYEPNGGMIRQNFHSFAADSHRLLASTLLKSTSRGRINSQGLAAANGIFITGGFDNQTMVLVDPTSLKVKVEILLPRCSLPAGFNNPKPLSAAGAIRAGLTGSNNWSGGICPGTLRNADDRRFAVLDGFAWSPQDLTSSGADH
jgi:hypothetical protein